MDEHAGVSRRKLLGSVSAAMLLAGCGGPETEREGATDDDPNEREGEDPEGARDDDGDRESIERAAAGSGTRR